MVATSLFCLQVDQTAPLFNALTTTIDVKQASQPKRGPVSTLPPQDHAWTRRQRGRRLSWFPSTSSQQLPPMSSRCGTGCARARGAALEGEGGGSRGCCFCLLHFVYEKRISAWLPTIYSGEGAPPEILLLPSQRADKACLLPSAFSPPAGAAET